MLQQILSNMKKIADENEGKKIEVNLQRGLKIDLKKISENYHLIISREKIQPSLKEWEIILRAGKFKYKNPTVYKNKNNISMMGILTDEH